MKSSKCNGKFEVYDEKSSIVRREELFGRHSPSNFLNYNESNSIVRRRAHSSTSGRQQHQDSYRNSSPPVTRTNETDDEKMLSLQFVTPLTNETEENVYDTTNETDNEKLMCLWESS